jgi:hypothetical protein
MSNPQVIVVDSQLLWYLTALSASFGATCNAGAYLQAPFTGLQSEKKFLTLLLSFFGPKKA